MRLDPALTERNSHMAPTLLVSKMAVCQPIRDETAISLWYCPVIDTYCGIGTRSYRE